MIPIPDAIAIVRVALYSALSPLCASYNGRPKCYWLVAEQGAPLPLMISQSQDNGGQDASFLNGGGWEGLITVKALAASQSAAEALLAGVPAALEGMAHPSGYTIRATFDRPLVLPPKDGVYQDAQIWHITLYRV